MAISYEDSSKTLKKKHMAESTFCSPTLAPITSRRIPCAAPTVHFHASARREEEANASVVVPESSVNVSKAWYALPIGIAAAVPALRFEWYIVNEETQLAACFIAFCVAFYSGLGDMLHKMMTEPGLEMLKEHNEVERKLIEALEQELLFYKAQGNKADDFEAINQIRAKAYADLNAAGLVKPQHDLKAQMERVVAMIAVEEARVAEGEKTLLMEAATASVTAQFAESKALKKAALESAIAKIEGTAKAGEDPVTAAFVKFFKDTGAAAAKKDDKAESLALRASIIAKMNAVCKNEHFMFEFDASGKPKMLV